MSQTSQMLHDLWIRYTSPSLGHFWVTKAMATMKLTVERKKMYKRERKKEVLMSRLRQQPEGDSRPTERFVKKFGLKDKK